MEGIFLGKVQYAPSSYSRLLPLAQLEGRVWQAIANAGALFPSEGRLFCLESGPTTSPKDSFWTFTARRNPRQGHGPDEFLAESLEPAIPIVDLTSLSLECARKELYEVGVELPPLAQGTTCVLFAEECVGKFRLVRDGTSMLWRATPSIELVPLYRASPAWSTSIPLDGFRYLPRGETMSSQVVRRVDWSSDADFVEHVLNRFRRLGQRFADTEYELPAKHAVAFVARALRESGVLPNGDEDFAPINERLRAQWPVIQARLAGAYEFRDLILESQPAKKLIDRATVRAVANLSANLRDELEPKVRSELEAELGTLQRDRDLLLDEIDEVRRELESLSSERDEVEGLCAGARKALKTLTVTLGEEMAGVRESLRDLSASELPFARAVVARLEAAIGVSSDDEAVPLLPSALPPWGAPGRAGVSPARRVPLSQLGERLNAEAEAQGIEKTDFVALDAFARAGEIVLLLGDAAERALWAYARCVSGGVLRAMSLDPSCIGLDDLWRTPGDHLPTAFAHAWMEARAVPEVTLVVCLRELDAAPFQLWLAALEGTLRSAVRPPNLLITATAACVPDQVESKHPFVGEIRKRLIPLQPGSTHDACYRALRPIEGEASILVNGSVSDEAVGHDLLTIVAGAEATDPTNVRRASRLANAATSVCGREVALDFAGTWFRSSCHEDGTVNLTPGLRSGYGALEHLNFHH
jgi:hypothetical protein